MNLKGYREHRCELCDCRWDNQAALESHLDTVAHKVATQQYLRALAVGALANLREYERKHNLTEVHVKGVRA